MPVAIRSWSTEGRLGISTISGSDELREAHARGLEETHSRRQNRQRVQSCRVLCRDCQLSVRSSRCRNPPAYDAVLMPIWTFRFGDLVIERLVFRLDKAQYSRSQHSRRKYDHDLQVQWRHVFSCDRAS